MENYKQPPVQLRADHLTADAIEYYRLASLMINVYAGTKHGLKKNMLFDKEKQEFIHGETTFDF